MYRKKPEQDPYEGLSPKERKAAMRKAAFEQMFGPPPQEPIGNMWGWRFSLLGLILLLSLGAFAVYGVRTGLIDFEEQMRSGSESPLFKRNQPKQDSLPKQ